MQTRTVAELTAARDKIANGWAQNIEMTTDDDGQLRFCSIGALRMAVLEQIGHRGPVQERLYNDQRVVEMAITELTTGPWEYDLIDWNDAAGRTQAEVVEAFDRAIKIAERDEL